MKVALVHDFLTKLGGAENVLKILHDMFPEAPVYTLLYDEKGTRGQFKEYKVITSSLQTKPAFMRKPRFLFSKLPRAIEEFDLSGFDLVISSSNSFAHGIITPPKTFHLSYCHSPMRYAWDWHHEYLAENNIGFGLKGFYVRNLIHNIRIWDRVAADRVDLWLANSKTIQARIKKYYRKDSIVLYPPVETKLESDAEIDKREDNYLIVSRLEPYKNIRFAVEAFNKLGKKLVIIGEGSEYETLKVLAKENVKFLGWQSRESVENHFGKAKAFLFPGEDDFGITPVEAMAHGCPVIALRKGGATETVIDQKTGVFFDEPTADAIITAVNHFESISDNVKIEDCQKQAAYFSVENFQDSLRKIIDNELINYKKKIGL